jgi:uncharacterized protein involved in type VI secretion and phage assembly
MTSYFDAPPAPVALFGAQLGQVVDVQDPDGLGRIRVRLLNFDGVADQDAPIWARVAVPFAGNNRGAFFIPDVGDEVLVNFVNGDPRVPIVVGGLWNGSQSPPETLSGSSVDRWTITGKAGTKIAIIEQTSPQIVLQTPNGQKVMLDDTSNEVTITDATGNKVTLNTSGITLQATSKITMNATQIELNAGSVTVNASSSTFSGIVNCNTLITTSVVSSMYTPGAGNIW